MPQDIVLTCDYHNQTCVLRRLDRSTGTDQVLSVPTQPEALARVVAQARRQVGPGGRVIWIQESTTGWARVQQLLAGPVEFRLANVLQRPRPPKGHRRQTDKVDTARMQREFVAAKLEALQHLQGQLHQVGQELLAAHRQCPDAQRVDAIRGIGVVAAVSIVARVGPIERFRNAEQLIAFAGLAPGVQQSDRTRRDGRIGGGGTDKHLRHYLIEASVWARQLPRYQATYERVRQRRGPKISRLVVARLLLGSIYKVLRDGVAFEPTRPAPKTQ